MLTPRRRERLQLIYLNELIRTSNMLQQQNKSRVTMKCIVWILTKLEYIASQK